MKLFRLVDRLLRCSAGPFWGAGPLARAKMPPP